VDTGDGSKIAVIITDLVSIFGWVYNILHFCYWWIKKHRGSMGGLHWLMKMLRELFNAVMQQEQHPACSNYHQRSSFGGHSPLWCRYHKGHISCGKQLLSLVHFC